MTGMEGVWMGHREWIWASLNKSLLMYASLWGRNGITVLRRHLQKQQHENKGSIDQTDSTMLHTLHYLWMWWGSGKGQNVHKAITFKKEWEREWVRVQCYICFEWAVGCHTRPFGWRTQCGSPVPPDDWCSWRLQPHPVLSDSPWETTRVLRSPRTAGHQPTHHSHKQ